LTLEPDKKSDTRETAHCFGASLEENRPAAEGRAGASASPSEHPAMRWDEQRLVSGPESERTA